VEVTDMANPSQRSSNRGPVVLSAVLCVAVVATMLALGTATAPPAGAADLVRIADCDELQALTALPAQPTFDEVDDGAVAVGAGDVDTVGGPVPAVPPATSTAERSMAADLEGSAAEPEGLTVGDAAEAGGTGGTGATNVQVGGVDELDVAEIIGDRVLTTGPDQRIRLVEADGTVRTGPAVGEWTTLFSWDGGPAAWTLGLGWDQASGQEVVTLARLRIEDLAVVGSWQAPGRLVGARAVDGQARLVIADDPWSRSSEVLPFEAQGATAVPCGEVWRPAAATEPGVTDPGSVLVAAFDLAGEGELRPVATGQVVGGGEVVYATRDAVYVATGRYDGDGMSTEIHRFDAATMAPTGSGTVPGRLIGQFALDEHQGVLRVASTVEVWDQPVGIAVDDVAVDDILVEDIDVEPAPMPVDPAPGGRPGPGFGDTDNLVITLDTEGSLDELGRVDGLGKPGETIHGIRFQGDLAYVVTFLTTDPLYTVDLSDPRAPRVLGELEIPGFSAYLHPIAPGRVLGIGPAADGRAQAQLFDVSDPRSPRSLDVELLGDDSPAIWDHLAFAPLGDGRFAVPVESWSDTSPPPAPVPFPRPEPEPEPEPTTTTTTTTTTTEPAPTTTTTTTEVPPGPEPSTTLVPGPEPEPAPEPEPTPDPGEEPDPSGEAAAPTSAASTTGAAPSQDDLVDPAEPTDGPGSDPSIDPVPPADGPLSEPGPVPEPTGDLDIGFGAGGPAISVVVAEAGGDAITGVLRFRLPSFSSWSGMVRLAGTADGGFLVVTVGGGVARFDGAGTLVGSVAF
jgi:hypothetical protein